MADRTSTPSDPIPAPPGVRGVAAPLSLPALVIGGLLTIAAGFAAFAVPDALPLLTISAFMTALAGVAA